MDEAEPIHRGSHDVKSFYEGMRQGAAFFAYKLLQGQISHKALLEAVMQTTHDEIEKMQTDDEQPRVTWCQ